MSRQVVPLSLNGIEFGLVCNFLRTILGVAVFMQTGKLADREL